MTIKSDVYSFGVVLLELMTGKRAMDEERPGVEETLIDWAKPFLSDERRIFRIMDTRLEGQYPKKGAQAGGALALRCLDADSKSRPSMKDVLTTLELMQSAKTAPGTPRRQQGLRDR